MDSIELIKKLIKKKSVKTQRNLRVGDVIIYQYDPKDKRNTYDRTPLVMVLRKSKSYMLGLNLHWCPIPMRMILIKFLLKINKKNIKQNNQFEINYTRVKPLLYKLGFHPVIRLYIRNRMSDKMVIIPHQHMLEVIKTKSETFTGGISAERMYLKAVKDSRKRK